MSIKLRVMSANIKSFLRNKKVQIVLAIVFVLIAARLALPYVVLHYANKSLAGMKGYYGQIKDVDISLYRGAYQIKDMYIDKKDTASGKQTDFFKVKHIDLSVEWKAILDGAVVGEIDAYGPNLTFIKDKTELGQVKKDTTDFRKVLKDLMPLKVNRFEVYDGTLSYLDNSSQPKVDLSLKEIHILATNLSNAADSTTQLPAKVLANAKAYEGTMNLDMKLNPLAKAATFDLNAEVKNTNLVLLNDFLKAYANFDVNRGNFGLYTEMAAKDGKFKGYVKPIIKDLDVVGPEDKNDSFLHKIYENLVGGLGHLFKNPKKEQVATKVTLEGSFKNPETQTLEAVWEVIRNAFIQALLPSVDHQININSVNEGEPKEKPGFFKKLFSSDKDKKKKNKE